MTPITKEKQQTKLSETMRDALNDMKRHGGLERLPGGFWCPPGTKFNGSYPAASWFGTKTIQACVDRNVATYTKWQKRRRGESSFPVRVEFFPEPEDSP